MAIEDMKEYQFKPGQSGNPNGRPKGAKDGLRAHLIRQLQKKAHPGIIELVEELGVDLENPTNAAALSVLLLDSSAKGDIRAAKLIADLTEIPLKQHIELTGADDAPLRVVVEYVDAEEREDG